MSIFYVLSTVYVLCTNFSCIFNYLGDFSSIFRLFYNYILYDLLQSLVLKKYIIEYDGVIFL